MGFCIHYACFSCCFLGFNTPIPSNGNANVEQHHDIVPGQISYNTMAVSAIQFILGAWLWVSGQQVGSILCTGLGYWVVFDLFGVALSRLIPGWLSRSSNTGFGVSQRRRGKGFGDLSGTIFLT